MLLLVKIAHGVRNGVGAHYQLKTPPSSRFFYIVSLELVIFISSTNQA